MIIRQSVRRWGCATACSIAASFLLPLPFASAQQATQTAAAATETPYTEYAEQDCTLPTSLACGVEFKAAPRGKQLHITRASCNLTVPANTGIASAMVIAVAPRRPTKDHSNFIVPTLVGTDASHFVYQSNQSVNVYAESGWHVAVTFGFLGSGTGKGTMACLLSGTIATN